MLELSSSQRARAAIREFKTITDSLTIRGFYRPSGKFGTSLENCLKELSPEIYGSMNDSRVVELKGIEYVIDRLPQGIEYATKIILTDEDQFEGSSFVTLEPLKRRRTCYRINNNEICFIISRGISEIYDIITHMTFLNIEAGKIFQKMHDDYGNVRSEWLQLERVIRQNQKLSAGELDSAILNMSIILGRPYHETRESYDYLEKNRTDHQSNNGLFSLIYHMVKRIERDHQAKDEALTIYFTPSLMNIIGHQKYGKIWATTIERTLMDLNLHGRPLHIVSANMHSVINLVYGYAAMKQGGSLENLDLSRSVMNHGENRNKTNGGGRENGGSDPNGPSSSTDTLYDFFRFLKEKTGQVIEFAQTKGLTLLPDRSGANIDCQIIDTAKLEGMSFHPELNAIFGRLSPDKPPSEPVAVPSSVKPTPEHSATRSPVDPSPETSNALSEVDPSPKRTRKSASAADPGSPARPLSPSSDLPVILVMDYAFGAQAFELMEQLLKPYETDDGEKQKKQVGSISIMGKAGILPGNKRDILLATAHVCEGSTDNYLFDNELTLADFPSDDEIKVFIGPMATVLGTSLQNRDILKMFKTDWNAIGLEMEGGYYQKAINAAVIKGNIPADTRIRYAYYASDNPLMTGNTLAAGAMGQEGIKPTYMITKVIIEKIFK